MKWLFAALVLLVIALHQDFWLWNNRSLVLGILPIGLAYHVGYSILASLTMWVLVTFLWPRHLEEADDAGPVPIAPSTESRS